MPNFPSRVKLKFVEAAGWPWACLRIRVGVCWKLPER